MNTMKKDKNPVSIEIEAKTIGEAIKKALEMLHAEEQEITIKILKEEHKGLFGMEGAKLAKIRATLKASK